MLLLKMSGYRVRMSLSPTRLKLVVLDITLAFRCDVTLLNLLWICQERVFPNAANMARPDSIKQIHLKINSGDEIHCYIPE